MFDPILLIKAIGLIGIFLIIFTETGFFLGFFLPGDTLLFTAGIFAFQGFFNIYVLLLGCIIMAILGDSMGYWMGKKYGRRLFKRDESFFFKKKYLTETEDFYKKHGEYTIIIARFLPIIRTFAPVIGGIGKMDYFSFLSYNIFGGIFWVSLVLLSGYFLGGLIPNINNYLILIIATIVVVSFLPLIFKIFKYKLKK